MNVARAKKLQDGSYDLLARELQLYLDPTTNEVLHTWTNPFTQENVTGVPFVSRDAISIVLTIPVIHVQNNPTYQTIPSSSSYPLTSLAGGYKSLTYNIPLAYPNPLNPSNDPNSRFAPFQGSYQALYSAVECFTFSFASSELATPNLSSIPSTQIYWTRTSPMLPWMKSPDTNATLLFTGKGYKVNSFEDLDATTRSVIEETLPAYKVAPEERIATGGGVTSWNFFTNEEVFERWLNGTHFPIKESWL
jgi:hypothetical protein